MNAIESTSTRPYLIRALYEWCTDNGFTPYVAVLVDDTVQVPREYVKNGEIVLNISYDATSSLKLGNEFIEFKARFAGIGRDIMIPVAQVLAIYARENGQGMAFPVAGPGAAAQAPPPRTHSPLSSVQAPPSDPSPTAERSMQLIQGEGTSLSPESQPAADDEPTPPKPPAGGARPSLKRVK